MSVGLQIAYKFSFPLPPLPSWNEQVPEYKCWLQIPDQSVCLDKSALQYYDFSHSSFILDLTASVQCKQAWAVPTDWRLDLAASVQCKQAWAVPTDWRLDLAASVQCKQAWAVPTDWWLDLAASVQCKQAWAVQTDWRLDLAASVQCKQAWAVPTEWRLVPELFFVANTAYQLSQQSSGGSAASEVFVTEWVFYWQPVECHY